MSKYIDVNLLFECNTCRHYVNRKCTTFCDYGESYSPAVSKLPIADVVEVVRCKDCMYKKNAETNHKGFLICSASGMEITDDDFCSYGERKRNGE